MRAVSRADLSVLVDRISHDPDRFAAVADVMDHAELRAVVLRLAADEALDVTEEDVVEMLREARTAWLARWV